MALASSMSRRKFKTQPKPSALRGLLLVAVCGLAVYLAVRSVNTRVSGDEFVAAGTSTATELALEAIKAHNSDGGAAGNGASTTDSGATATTDTDAGGGGDSEEVTDAEIAAAEAELAAAEKELEAIAQTEGETQE